MAKWVYMFTEGNANMRNLLGGKGANLAEMTNLGLPVPQGFTITTEACTQYYEDGRQINDEIMAQIMEAITKMEGVTGKKFGDKENPLLVSVRSHTGRRGASKGPLSGARPPRASCSNRPFIRRGVSKASGGSMTKRARSFAPRPMPGGFSRGR